MGNTPTIPVEFDEIDEVEVQEIIEDLVGSNGRSERVGLQELVAVRPYPAFMF